MIEFRSASMLRRLGAIAVDLTASLAAVAIGYMVGFLDPAPFQVETGWFWTEWWLRHWIEDASIFTTPVLTLVVTHWLWTASWQIAAGRTPGDRVMGIEILDSDGDDPPRWRLVVRAVLMLLVPLTFGLTWLWGIVSPARRTLHDVLSGTYAVLVE